MRRQVRQSMGRKWPQTLKEFRERVYLSNRDERGAAHHAEWQRQTLLRSMGARDSEMEARTLVRLVGSHSVIDKPLVKAAIMERLDELRLLLNILFRMPNGELSSPERRYVVDILDRSESALSPEDVVPPPPSVHDSGREVVFSPDSPPEPVRRRSLWRRLWEQR